MIKYRIFNRKDLLKKKSTNKFPVNSRILSIFNKALFFFYRGTSKFL
jgi:hypothetical protein